jgi:hypothetical protein
MGKRIKAVATANSLLQRALPNSGLQQTPDSLSLGRRS